MTEFPTESVSESVPETDAVLLFDDLNLLPTDEEKRAAANAEDGGWWIEAEGGDDTDFGELEIDNVEIISQLLDGAAVTLGHVGNREIPLRVNIYGTDSGAIAEGEAALHRVCDRKGMKVLGFLNPDRASALTVYDVLVAVAQHDFDDFVENLHRRAYRVSLTCKPWPRSETQREDVPAAQPGEPPPTPLDPVVVDDGSDASVWGATSGSTYGPSTTPPAGHTWRPADNKAVWGRRARALNFWRTRSLTTHGRPYLRISGYTGTRKNNRLYHGEALIFRINGVAQRPEKLTQSKTTGVFNAWIYVGGKGIAKFAVAASTSLSGNPDVVLAIDAVFLEPGAPSASTDKIRTRIVDIEGSKPAEGSIRVDGYAVAGAKVVATNRAPDPSAAGGGFNWAGSTDPVVDDTTGHSDSNSYRFDAAAPSTGAPLLIPSGATQATGSAWFKAAAGTTYSMRMGGAGAATTDSPVYTATGNWEFQSLTATAIPGQTAYFYPVRSATGKVWVDDLGLTDGAEAVDFNGNTPDTAEFAYDWVGTPFASNSTKSTLSSASVTPSSLGETAVVYTAPANGSEFQPSLAGYRTAGPLRTSDAKTPLSGGYSSLSTTSADADTYQIPIDLLTPGTYQLAGFFRTGPSGTGTYEVNWFASTVYAGSTWRTVYDSAWPALDYQWRFCPLGQITLPLIDTEQTPNGMINRFKIWRGEKGNVFLDTLLLFNINTGSVTVVDTSTVGDQAVVSLRLDAPNSDRPNQTAWVTYRSAGGTMYTMNADARVRAVGLHTFAPGPLLLWTATTGNEKSEAGVTYFPRWGTYAVGDPWTPATPPDESLDDSLG